MDGVDQGLNISARGSWSLNVAVTPGLLGAIISNSSLKKAATSTFTYHRGTARGV